MNTRDSQPYSVDGALLPRPFQIRRLGHFGINVSSVDRALDFYGRLLGFEISDQLDFGPRLSPEARAEVGPTLGYFTRHGTDHHSFVLFPRAAVQASNPHYRAHPRVNVNQITWQVGSLREVVDGLAWCEAQQCKIMRAGRDTPGSNWHFYPADPAGHINELYYGIEQIGWSGHSKPAAVHHVRYTQPPHLPHRSEFDEVNQAIENGVDLSSGYRRRSGLPQEHDVGGVLLARPFKIVKIGPVRLFVDDMAAALRFYQQTLGLALTETVEVAGKTCHFLRANTEHHSVALVPEALRDTLEIGHQQSLLGFGLQVAGFGQLRRAVSFLEAAGCRRITLPQALSPGLGHHAWFLDPDGNAVQLFWEMEQIGWSGTPRPAEQRRPWPLDPAQWPAAVDSLTDSFMGEVFLGPLD